jgi:phosphoglycerate kinase
VARLLPGYAGRLLQREVETLRDILAAPRHPLVAVVGGAKVTDNTRIRAALPTIKYLREKGARLVLLSHLGRPKGGPDPKYSMQPVVRELEKLLGAPVTFLADPTSEAAVTATRRLPRGGVAVGENTRFYPGEEQNDPALAERFAALGDLYVNDAFGSAHRAHASTEGITHFLPSVAGLLLEREVDALSRILEKPAKPFHTIIGGAKVSGKIEVLEALLSRCQAILVGGGMANTFLVAKGHALGKSLVETEQLENAERIMVEARRKRVRFMLPTDAVVAAQIHPRSQREVVPIGEVPKDWSVVDIGPDTVAAYTDHLAKAKTIFWNGPMGVFEIPAFADGTNAIARYVAGQTSKGVVTIVGGGDSVAAVEGLGLSAKMTHVSTGGGASLEFVEGKTLPGVEALLDADQEGAA